MVTPAADWLKRVRGLWPSIGRGASAARVGIVIGRSAIKLVELRATPEGPRVVSAFLQELPQEHDGQQPVDRLGWLQAALKETHERRVVLVLDGTDVVIRRLKIPLMSHAEVAEAVRWQLKDDLPCAPQDAALAVEVLGDVWEKDIKKLDVVVAAVATTVLEAHVRLVEQASGRVVAVVPSAMAAQHAVIRVLPELSTQAVVLLDIGVEHSEVTVLKDGQIRLVRTLPLGGRHLTQALVGVARADGEGAALDYAKAEQWKCQYGMVPESGAEAMEEGFSLGQLSALMRSVLETLLTEIARLLDFYKVHVDDAGVSRVVVFGGGANLKHLDAWLGQGLGLSVQRFDPFEKPHAMTQTASRLPHAGEGVRLVTALGAALEPNRLNVFTKRTVGGAVVGNGWRARVKPSGLILGLAAVLALGVEGVLYGWQCLRVRQAQTEWTVLEPAYRQVAGVRAQRQATEAMVDALTTFADAQPVWDGVLKELAVLLPTEAQLTAIEWAPGQAGTSAVAALHLRGSVQTAGGAQGALGDLLDAMEASVFFSEVRLMQTTIQSQATVFDIRCQLE